MSTRNEDHGLFDDARAAIQAAIANAKATLDSARSRLDDAASKVTKIRRKQKAVRDNLVETIEELEQMMRRARLKAADDIEDLEKEIAPIQEEIASIEEEIAQHEHILSNKEMLLTAADDEDETSVPAPAPIVVPAPVPTPRVDTIPPAPVPAPAAVRRPAPVPYVDPAPAPAATGILPAVRDNRKKLGLFLLILIVVFIAALIGWNSLAEHALGNHKFAQNTALALAVSALVTACVGLFFWPSRTTRD